MAAFVSHHEVSCVIESIFSAVHKRRSKKTRQDDYCEYIRRVQEVRWK